MSTKLQAIEETLEINPLLEREEELAIAGESSTDSQAEQTDASVDFADKGADEQPVDDLPIDTRWEARGMTLGQQT